MTSRPDFSATPQDTPDGRRPASPAGTYRRLDEDLTRPAAPRMWRVVDIVGAAVLAVACGLIFWAYNTPGNAFWTWLDAAVPGLSGLANGVWLLGGPLGGLVIRKPGAAILVETLAAVVSASLGNQWGISTVWIGLLQGLGAEIAIALWLYRRSSLPVGLLSGALAGVGCWFYSWVTNGLVMTFAYNALYLLGSMVSGAIVGALAWVVMVRLRVAGALVRFASARM